MAKKKTEEKIANIKKQLEIKTYKHKDVEVTVRINYVTEKIDLVEEPNQGQDYTVAKKWVFAGRGPEFMQGWQNILDAMKYAIDLANLELRAEIAKRELLTTLEDF